MLPSRTHKKTPEDDLSVSYALFTKCVWFQLRRLDIQSGDIEKDVIIKKSQLKINVEGLCNLNFDSCMQLAGAHLYYFFRSE